MLYFLCVIGSLLGIAGFGFIVSNIKNEEVRVIILILGVVLVFLGFIVSMFNGMVV